MSEMKRLGSIVLAAVIVLVSACDQVDPDWTGEQIQGLEFVTSCSTVCNTTTKLVVWRDGALSILKTGQLDGGSNCLDPAVFEKQISDVQANAVVNSVAEEFNENYEEATAEKTCDGCIQTIDFLDGQHTVLDTAFLSCSTVMDASEQALEDLIDQYSAVP